MSVSASLQIDINRELQKSIALYNSNNVVSCYESVVPLYNLAPDNVDLKFLLAACLVTLDRDLDVAEKILFECLAVINNSDQLFMRIGALYHKKGEILKAIEYYKSGLAINPDNEILLNDVGNLYSYTGEFNLALECFDKLLKRGNSQYYIYNNIALIYQKLWRLDEALMAINQCFKLKPDCKEAYHVAALIYTAIGHKENARRYYALAAESFPNDIDILSEYRDLCMHVCDWKKLAELDLHIKYLVETYNLSEKICPMGNIERNIDPAMNLEYARKYTQQQTQIILSAHKPFLHQKHKKKKLRIGYLSSDIKPHPVAYLMRGVFRNHNKNDFEVYLYSSSGDTTSSYAKEIISYCDKVVDIKNFPGIDVSNLIYNDKIDILIDLIGHTGTSRIDSLSLKPAPVQATYLGFIGSTGADFIDYVITDKIVTPPDQQKYYTEKFAYMPNCYQANDELVEISSKELSRKDYNLPEDAFVFCSFNQTAKIEPVMFKCWMNILNRVPGSVLWLYRNSSYESDTAAIENLQAEAVAYGIDPARLVFADMIHLDVYIKRMGLADLALDTRIYNGGTVTSHTLWGGTPVLTLQGGHFASRMASSLLTALGMEELITYSLEEYEELAVKIATDKNLLQSLKKKLETNKNTSTLFDSKKFTHDLEQLYLSMWSGEIKG